MTPKQNELYKFIRNKILHFGKAPTFAEMKLHMEVTSNQTIEDWLIILEREDYIARNKGVLRGISLTDKGLKAFDETLTIQKNEAIKTFFTPFTSNATTSPMVFSTITTNFNKGTLIISNNALPSWKGGEKDGSS